MKLWHVTTGECLQTLEGHSNAVRSVSFFSRWDEGCVGVFSEGKAVGLTSGESLLTLEGHLSYVLDASFSPDGTKVASGSTGKTVKLLNVTSGQCLQTLEGHSDCV